MVDTIAGGVFTMHKRKKIMATGSEPQVPGAIGKWPRPKQDVSSLFIIKKG
jgi:hypothetical protein